MITNIFFTIIIYPITQIIEFTFVFAQKLFRETGISIICVSGAISILCLPLYMVAERWQEAERDIQKRLAPKIAKIKAVFRGDERYMILSVYYRQNQYHPIYALRSSFALLIQIPFFIAAYSYLSHLELLKGASFLFFTDLGKPDALMGGINLLPILMTLINCTAGIIYTYNFVLKDKIPVFGMSLIFLVLLFNAPSGLVLYWTLNNVFSLFKNLYFTLKIPKSAKRIALYSSISLLCFFMVFYAMVMSSGVLKTRITVSCVLSIIGILPWVFPLFSNLLNRIYIATYSTKEQILIFMLSCFSLWILTGFFIPSMLILSSPQEFSFIDTYTTPLYFIFNTALQSLGFCIFWTTILFFLFSRKMKNIFVVAGLVISCSALANTFIFPGDHGNISINMIFDRLVSYNIKVVSANFLLMLFLFIIVLVFFLAGWKKICVFMGFVPVLALAAYSVMNLVTINEGYNNLAKYYKPESINVKEINPIFHLSRTGKNVVVMMLDRAAGVFMPYIFKESPELYEKYSGFTFYPNTVSFSAFTKDGSPPLFGGYEYAPLEMNKRDTVSLVEKRNEALLTLPRLFSDAGFSVTATDPPYANGNWKSDLRIYNEYPEITAYVTDGVYTDLWLHEHNLDLPSTSDVLKRNILWYSFFRTIPVVLRQSIYTDGNWCAPITGHALRITINGYSVIDYLPRLTDFSPEKENTALIMVNNTTHADTFMQAPDYRPVVNCTNFGTSPFPKQMPYHTNAATMKKLPEWFDFLKKEGVYDNTRIILVADHGPTSRYSIRTVLPYDVDFIADHNPILFVKDFNAEGDLKIDNTFMTNADAPSLALQGIIENPCNPFTGNKICMDDKVKPLYIAMGRLTDKSNTQVNLNPGKDYYIQKNIFEMKNWEPANKP